MARNLIGVSSLNSPGAGSREPGATVGTGRRLVVVVRTLATLDRLRDVLSLTAGDWRIQTFFTHDAERRSPLAAGVAEALTELGAPLLPWSQAVNARFDLVIAASENDHLVELDAPVLLVPHGAGQQKFYANTSVISGLTPHRLVVNDDVVPTAIGLPHATQLDGLARVSPAVAARGVVVGDPALARMQGSQFRAAALRAAFGAREKRLVVVASTFGPDSTLGRLPNLPERLARALPVDEYQVVMVLHPGVWAAHGRWQVRGWLAQAVACGVQVLAPHDGWQAALLAASVVISDAGSLSLYAAALDSPLLLVGRGSAVTVPDSAMALLTRTAPVWDVDRAAREQIDAVIDQYVAGTHEPVVTLFAAPDLHGDNCARQLRRLIYDLLKLDEPPIPAMLGPVLAPLLSKRAVPALVVGVEFQLDGARIERYPDLGYGQARRDLEYRHLVADLRTATMAQLCSASILVTGDGGSWSTRAWRTQAAEELAQWPSATMLAAAVDDRSCAIWSRDQGTLLRADEPLDPIVLASLAYGRLVTGDHIPAEDRLRLGGRVIRVAATG